MDPACSGCRRQAPFHRPRRGPVRHSLSVWSCWPASRLARSARFRPFGADATAALEAQRTVAVPRRLCVDPTRPGCPGRDVPHHDGDAHRRCTGRPFMRMRPIVTRLVLPSSSTTRSSRHRDASTDAPVEPRPAWCAPVGVDVSAPPYWPVHPLLTVVAATPAAADRDHGPTNVVRIVQTSGGPGDRQQRRHDPLRVRQRPPHHGPQRVYR